MKKTISIFFLALFTMITLESCKNREEGDTAYSALANWDYAQAYYLRNIKETDSYLDSLSTVKIESARAKDYFIKARQAFKRAEPYVSYLNPEVGHRTNGPALPVFLEDTERILEPLGLQKIEESIYEGDVDEAIFLREISLTRGLVAVLIKDIQKRKLNAARFFIATHQQLLRVVSFSMANFDTPVSGLGLGEASLSLQSLYEVYAHSFQSIIIKKNEELDETFSNQIAKAVNFIGKNPDFETFDRFLFIRDHLNPITRSWVKLRRESGLWEGVSDKPFNFDAPTFFEDNSFNVDYFTPITNRNPSEKQIELGKRLFFDNQLSAGGTMACATCHIPEKAYTDGLVSNLNNKGNALQRNTPTLINSVFQKGYFWDGRSENLMDQISGVFTNKEEFDGSIHEFSNDILKDSSYVVAFQSVFGGNQWNNGDVIKAISSYISTLNGFSSKFDKNIRGEENNYTAQEKEGFNIFMGKGLCATCHFMPLTGGTVPPFFADTEKEVIGVPETKRNAMLDDDLGFYWRYGKAEHLGMFKTPSIRNAALTAPYMHNGVYNTLDEVMDFYNKGGGGGLGFDLPHQTLPFDNLKLTDAEMQALVAFIKSLNDVSDQS